MQKRNGKRENHYQLGSETREFFFAAPELSEERWISRGVGNRAALIFEDLLLLSHLGAHSHLDVGKNEASLRDTSAAKQQAEVFVV